MPVSDRPSEHLHSKTASIDRKMMSSLSGSLLHCSKGHKNGPTARFCWVCGEFLQDALKNKKGAGSVRVVPYEGNGGHPVIEIEDPVFNELKALAAIKIKCQANNGNSVAATFCVFSCIIHGCMNSAEVVEAQKTVEAQKIKAAADQEIKKALGMP